jgi:hypothetical protein
MRGSVLGVAVFVSSVLGAGCGGTTLSDTSDASADARGDARRDSPSVDVAFDVNVDTGNEGGRDTGSRDTSVEAEGEGRCSTAASCPLGEACDVATGACTTECSDTQPCNGGCCAGTCFPGTASDSCGNTGTACLPCMEFACLGLSRDGANSRMALSSSLNT